MKKQTAELLNNAFDDIYNIFAYKYLQNVGILSIKKLQPFVYQVDMLSPALLIRLKMGLSMAILP